MYPDAKAELHFRNSYELLVAAILSAQCTDKRVNIVTETLFSKFPTVQDMAALTPSQLEPYIQTCGLYHAKAKNCVAACKMICDEFGGEVPRTLDELTRLPGVGRKVANVVLSNAFGIPAIAVDTHVFRVSHRLGLADSKTVDGTEKQLMEIIPREMWSLSHHLLKFHGRRCCTARNPRCTECGVRELCEGKEH